MRCKCEICIHDLWEIAAFGAVKLSKRQTRKILISQNGSLKLSHTHSHRRVFVMDRRSLRTSGNFQLNQDFSHSRIHSQWSEFKSDEFIWMAYIYILWTTESRSVSRPHLNFLVNDISSNSFKGHCILYQLSRRITTKAFNCPKSSWSHWFEFDIRVLN